MYWAAKHQQETKRKQEKNQTKQTNRKKTHQGLNTGYCHLQQSLKPERHIFFFFFTSLQNKYIRATHASTIANSQHRLNPHMSINNFKDRKDTLVGTNSHFNTE